MTSLVSTDLWFGAATAHIVNTCRNIATTKSDTATELL